MKRNFICLAFFLFLSLFFVSALNESCEDSDGGIDYYIKGTTTRIASDDTGRVKTDSCTNDILLVEYYCVGNYVGSRGMNCPGGCLDGVCLEKEQGTCTDSDDGRNYEVKGRTVSNYCVDCTIKNTPKDAYDICFKDSASYPEQDENKLFEYRCDEYGWFASEYYDCPNFCHDGACVDEITEEMAEQRDLEIEEESSKYFCSDPDGGKDVYVTSSVSGSWVDGEYFVYWDQCEGDDKVKEYYCDGDDPFPAYDIIDCPDGCDGAQCVGSSTGESYCDDSDGGKNIYEKGLVKGNVGSLIRAHYDLCMIEESVSEFSTKYDFVSSCSGDNCYITEYFPIGRAEGESVEVCTSDIVKCPKGCEDGACLGDGNLCSEDWECGGWSSCSEGSRTRRCTDKNWCGTSSDMPAISESCTIQGENQGQQQDGGRNDEVKIMPEVASEKAIERLGELNFTIVLKEVGVGDNNKLVYELTGMKSGRFLGIFKILARVQVQIDSDTGEVIKVSKPWWSFLATNI